MDEHDLLRHLLKDHEFRRMLGAPPAARHVYAWHAEGTCLLGPPGHPTKDGKWAVSFGIHKGTLMTRDSDHPTTGLESFAACQAYLRKQIDYFARMGYYIWFAEAIAPDGTRHKLVEGAHYV